MASSSSSWISAVASLPTTTTPSRRSRAWPVRSTRNWTASFRSRSRFSRNLGGSCVASAGSAVAQIIGKVVREGKLSYYVNDGVYHTFSGVIFDHCQYSLKSFKKGPTQLCSVFGPTCDALDTISLAEQLPDMELGDFIYARNIGAYSAASSTFFNGFPPARVVHVNE